MKAPKFHFDVSTGLKRVLGRELITDAEVAIFELVKNSFDAGADVVHLFFGDDKIVVADNGSGMSLSDLREKWLFVAYSAKHDNSSSDYRNIMADRAHFAGSKGIGRFSSDRLGERLALQTRSEHTKSPRIEKLEIDWSLFEKNDREHFENIPIKHAISTQFDLPNELEKFRLALTHGTVIEISDLRASWGRNRLKSLKANLAKLINPFGAEVDRFNILITAPSEEAQDERVRNTAREKNEDPVARDIVNGKVGNFIFADLQEKTTFIKVTIKSHKITTELVDRGEVVYKIREPNPYDKLENSEFRCEIFYLNHSAKTTFARRVGLPSVQFGSVFLFRNDFRVFPIGEDGDDWFGFARRKQQGYARHLGTREVIGRVDVVDTGNSFQEASSRNQGLIETPTVEQLRECVMKSCLQRLEKYVVPVSWVDKAEADSDDLSRLLTDPGKARVSAAVANLVSNNDVELLTYSKKLINLVNERSSDFESSIASLRTIASKLDDRKYLTKLDLAEKRFKELKKSEAEARETAERERAATLEAIERAQHAEKQATEAQAEAAIERRRAHFLTEVIDLDISTILNLHHQVTIYSVDIHQQIENLIQDAAGKKTLPRETFIKSIEQVAFLNRKIQAITRFATKANFQLDSERITTDLTGFLVDYVENISRVSSSARMHLEIENLHEGGYVIRFNPIDISIVVDNLVSNAKRARASLVKFCIEPLGKSGMLLRVTDNGRGLAKGANPRKIFDMGYTTTHGSGLGLYHVRQVLGEMGGTIELDDEYDKKGTSFVIKIAGKRQK
ncbi:MAG: sensor histidine kinase [Gammaproteobacteria bacterium]|nr:sensor histidine kinase [Gammaproteobacteria bacterium]